MGFMSMVGSGYSAVESSLVAVEKSAETVAIAATGAQLHCAVAIADSLPTGKVIDDAFKKLGSTKNRSIRVESS